jgi:uncharacterized protein YgbK (DUF1537 family)
MPSLATLPLLLAGCVTEAPNPAVPAPPAKPRAIVVCGTVANITKAQQAQAASEIEKLPADSVVANIIIPDWVRQRDDVRACRNQKPGTT